MNFQISCMVFVPDEQQQIEIQKWMNGIGWRILGGRDSKRCFLVADTDQNAALWLELDRGARACFSQDYYDCSENIELFKVLAAMNDENDYMQLFINKSNRYRMVLCNTQRLFDAVAKECDWRKATAAEIVEHFKKREK